MPNPLTDDDFKNAATTLGCDVPAIKAVCAIEAPRGGFLADGRPVILFESHQFHKLTGGRYDESHPNISTATWVRNYGPAGAHQYDRLAEADALNHLAAIQSASWGRFQIMGLNYKAAGFDDPDSFVTAMKESEAAQLRAFVNFVKANHLDRPLADHQWATFARGYNGPSFSQNQYDVKLAQEYANFVQADGDEQP
jgi:hypothetical protein